MMNEQQPFPTILFRLKEWLEKKAQERQLCHF